MSSDLLVLLLLVLVVLLGSALCSGVEAALLTVSPIRVHELAARERPVAGARRLAQLRKRLGRTLSALVIANNGFNLFGSLMLGGYAAWVFEQRNISGVALPVFSVGLTVLVILLGEILPKALGSRLALPVALASAPLLHWLGLALRPLVLLLERMLPAITAEAELSTNEEEIRLLARLGSQKGEIEAEADCGGDQGGHTDLEQTTEGDLSENVFQSGEREFQTNRKKKENDSDLSNDLDGLRVVGEGESLGANEGSGKYKTGHNRKF